MRIFPACFLRGVWRRRGGAARPRLVDAWCDAVGSEERPFLGSFQKGGGARDGAERRAEPRSIKGGHARGAPSSLLGACSWLSSPPVCSLLLTVHPLSLTRAPFLLARSRARGPAGGLLVGDADGRRRRRPMVDLRVRTRRVSERVHQFQKGGFIFFELLYVCLWRQSVK